ncbi:SRPBCC family protein [Tsuneonella sp. CC-YZS046]|uniref:aromatic ring-hydroxylating oxygenase subunit alpha n=1 Tax=Tsuneonella sp. CC-YZS046 TaxID=3042152 RepID=UPI002D791653|nr:SRPBCC family protein [Tsuneonella sp. CC-YZS046]WRO66998.1 SRPBCC family protein [Tsuneonella sp. CC-YZS046]
MNSPLESSTFDIDHRFTQQSGLSTGPVPLEPYYSEEFYQAEKEQIFKRAWLVIGRVEDIPEPGDFMRRDVTIAGVSVLLTRTKGGEIRAFHNTCSHRGTEVVMAREGKASRFVCPYHNWTYRNDGSLMGVPDERAFFGVDKSKCGLEPIAVSIWEGYIFINLQKAPEVTLEEFLGPLADYLAGVPYTFPDNAFVVRADVGANWKIVSDAFLESYHIPAIHPETIGATFSSNENPFARLLDAKLLGQHAHVSMYGNPNFELQEKHKIDRVAQKLEGAGSVISANKLDDMQQFLAHPVVNPTKTSGWSMDSVHIFPHTHINWGPGGFWLHQFWPLAVDKTRHEARFFMAKPMTMRQRLQQELYVARVLEVIAEDLCNMERTQRGVSAGAKQFMQLQDNEVAIRRSIDNVMRWASAGTVKEALAA